MTPPNPALTRVEKKLDELGAGMTSILERLASIEATSKAEASERATIHSYTQSALDNLSKRIDDADWMKAPVYRAERDALLTRVSDLEVADERRNKEARQNRNLVIAGFVAPIITAVVAALLVYAIVGH